MKKINDGDSGLIAANTIYDNDMQAVLQWTAEAYPVGIKVLYEGIIWIANTATTLDDVPGASSAWVKDKISANIDALKADTFTRYLTNEVVTGPLDDNNRAGWTSVSPTGEMPDFVENYLFDVLANRYESTTKSNINIINCVGDSITEGGSPGPSYPSRLQDLLGSNKTVINEGHSGRESADLAVWTGGLTPILAASLTLPTTTTAVNIPAPIIPTIGKFKGFTVKGTLAGVRVTLNLADDETTFTITRESAGIAITIPSGTPFLSDGLNNLGDVLVWWTGQNDLAFGWPYYETAPRDCLQATLDKMPVEIKRFLAVSVTNATTNAEFKSVTATININLKARFPRNYVDMQDILITKGLAMAGITPTANDLIAIADGRIPGSLLQEGDQGVHPNDICKEKVIAPTIFAELSKRGWV